MPEHSMLSRYFEALGFIYFFLLPLAAGIAFITTFILVIKGRGPYCGTALLFIVPMPMLVGIYGAIDGMIRSYIVLSTSVMEPNPAEVAAGIATALVAPQVGLLLMLPSFLLAAGGMFLRAIMAKPAESTRV